VTEAIGLSSGMPHSRFSMVYGIGYVGLFFSKEKYRGQGSLLEKGNATTSMDKGWERRCTAVNN